MFRSVFQILTRLSRAGTMSSQPCKFHVCACVCAHTRVCICVRARVRLFRRQLEESRPMRLSEATVLPPHRRRPPRGRGWGWGLRRTSELALTTAVRLRTPDVAP